MRQLNKNTNTKTNCMKDVATCPKATTAFCSVAHCQLYILPYGSSEGTINTANMELSVTLTLAQHFLLLQVQFYSIQLENIRWLWKHNGFVTECRAWQLTLIKNVSKKQNSHFDHKHILVLQHYSSCLLFTLPFFYLVHSVFVQATSTELSLGLVVTLYMNLQNTVSIKWLKATESLRSFSLAQQH